jgi:hypothetical protein
MFRKSRLILIFTVLMMLLAIVAPTFAQEETFGLSGEDYALFTAANGQSMTFNSIGFDFAFDMSVAGVPDTEVAIKLNGTGAVDTGAGAAQFTITGNANMGTGDTPVNIEIRLLDDILYMNLGDGNGWVGMPAEDAMNSFTSGLGSALPVDPAALASGDIMNDPATMQAMSGIMEAFSSLNAADYVAISRGADETVMDMNAAHFTVNLDIAKFLSSESFTQLLTAGSEMAGGAEATGGMDMAQMAPMLGMMFQDTTFAFDQYIGVDDSMTHRGVLNFALNINPAMMGGSADSKPINIGLLLDVNNIAYDQPVSVEVPADVTMDSSGS